MLYQKKIILLRQFAVQIKEIGKELHVRVHKYNLIPANWKNNCISTVIEHDEVFFGIKSINNQNEEFSAHEMLSGEYAALNLWQSSILYDNITNEIQFWNDIESGKLKRFIKHFTEIILELYNNKIFLSVQ